MIWANIKRPSAITSRRWRLIAPCSVYFALGEKQKAKKYLQPAHAICKQFLGPEHPNTKTVGALFQGKFRDEHLGDTGYLMYLARYFHRNPIKHCFVSGQKSGNTRTIGMSSASVKAHFATFRPCWLVLPAKYERFHFKTRVLCRISVPIIWQRIPIFCRTRDNAPSSPFFRLADVVSPADVPIPFHKDCHPSQRPRRLESL